MGSVDAGNSQDQKGAAFRALHEGPPFVIPNPCDAGAAKVFAALGFEALATTSSGFAFTLGRLDGDVTLDEVVEHTHAIAAATSLPVSVDLENGHGDDPADAARAITRVAEAGAVGGSIEDWGPERGIYAIEHATERVAAAVEAARGLEFPFTVTARSENYLRGNPDLDDTVARLQSFERAGADVLFAPRVPGVEVVRAIRDATSKPLNVLAGPGLSFADIAEAGGQRISVGGRLTWVAVNAAVAAAEELRAGTDLPATSDPTRIVEWLSA
jgi:2-methylisocitrate lyase-like PEP mutase family enzyme